jgi:hypothetical protein
LWWCKEVGRERESTLLPERGQGPPSAIYSHPHPHPKGGRGRERVPERNPLPCPPPPGGSQTKKGMAGRLGRTSRAGRANKASRLGRAGRPRRPGRQTRRAGPPGKQAREPTRRGQPQHSRIADQIEVKPRAKPGQNHDAKTLETNSLNTPDLEYQIRMKTIANR